MHLIKKIIRSNVEWHQSNGLVLFTWNILNPNGPTVSCVGLRQTGKDAEIEVFYRWMHFLGGETYILGILDGSLPADDFDMHLRAILRKSFSENAGSILERFPLVSAVPSFVTTPNAPLQENDVFEMIVNSPEFQIADWGAQLYYLEKFKSNFFERAAEETRNAIEKFKKADQDITEDARIYAKFIELKSSELPGYKNWKPEQFVSRRIEEDDPTIWWATIYNEEFTLDCLGQLASAWVGAIYQYRSGDASKEIAESFEDVKIFMSHMKHDMWPSSWNTDLLLQNMNLK